LLVRAEGVGAGRGDELEAVCQSVVIQQIPPPGVADDFVEVYELQYPRLVRALELGGLGRPAAEDVAQEAFARTLAHWRRVRLGVNPAGYVYRVGFRLARRSLRRDEPLIYDRAARDDVSGQVTARHVVEVALEAMPVRRRSCAVLCLMAGFTPKEAARSLGIAEGTVRKQLELARRELRQLLGDSLL
jgi:RNA polymerase sigma factor (sigma-70 family)